MTSSTSWNKEACLLRGLHFGSYWTGANDIVYSMGQSLAGMTDTRLVDTLLYDSKVSPWCGYDYSHNPKRPVCWLNHDMVMQEAREQRPDFVVVNSGGMSLRPETINVLRQVGVVCICISLSDPDVFPDHGRVFAGLYDLVYTNSEYSWREQYPQDRRCRLLPFAAFEGMHRPMPEIEQIYDVVIVGHSRPDRQNIVRLMQNQSIKVGCYGKGWENGLGVVSGEAQVRAINTGKMYLSFSMSAAGYINVKGGIFEGGACRRLLLTDYFSEMEHYFKYGNEIVGFNSPDELIKAVHFYLDNPVLGDIIAANGYKRVLAEHTWNRRWARVLNDVLELKNQGNADDKLCMD